MQIRWLAASWNGLHVDCEVHERATPSPGPSKLFRGLDGRAGKVKGKPLWNLCSHALPAHPGSPKLDSPYNDICLICMSAGSGPREGFICIVQLNGALKIKAHAARALRPLFNMGCTRRAILLRVAVAEKAAGHVGSGRGRGVAIENSGWACGGSRQGKYVGLVQGCSNRLG
eukprot:scaffold235759_cov15-Tisochrysis_lutea.AAC.1